MINLKRHSKVVSIVLAMVMVFATAAVSFAAETEQTEPVTKNYNVKIYKKLFKQRIIITIHIGNIFIFIGAEFF